ncbi:pyruvate kinase [Acidocella sp.]|uniref:pyruvate kinase n=1 Tax=Acidocella sp. TaxID=50710 RepID=UPI002619A4E6|nr:pyruvate kinase [Acidocella sp.]
MRPPRNTRIVATLGPASSSADMIRALWEAGADMFRLNFSHGTHEDHLERFKAIRRLEAERGRPIPILADLQGPKLRLGVFGAGRVMLTPGQSFRLDLSDEPGDETRAPLPHPEILAALEPGRALLLDDGKIRLRVRACGAGFAETEVLVAGPLSNRKGVNIPDAVLGLSPLTAKDRKDLAFALELGIDWIALSFVQRPEDVGEARALIGGRARILSKLEKPSAIERLDEIVALSDAVMVARGDLGVELPPEDVPGLQKRILRAARAAGKPVVVATQMLESMIEAPTPTRAEASDVATAVFAGADAVMLSAESAAGRYPVEAVAMMSRIIQRVEHDPGYRAGIGGGGATPERTDADAISAAVCQVAGVLPVSAIVAYTSSGSTTLRIARERPEAPILSLTPSAATARYVALAWGVHSVHTEDAGNVEDMVAKATGIATREGFGAPGRPLVIIAGMPFGTPGATNLLRLARPDGPQTLPAG